MRRFEDKAVLITGAASGIGRATAERLAAEGASLFCVDVQPKGLEDAVGSIRAAGGKAIAHACDLADSAAPGAAVAAALTALGKLDVLCNIAGIVRMDKTHELELADWNRVIAINLTATFLMCKAAIPHLLARRGNIVNTASTAGIQGMPWGAAYGSSKAGVIGLTRALAVEYGKLGLRVNAICPGSIETPMMSMDMFPKGVDMKLVLRIMALDKARGPDTVAGVIAMLASDEGVHINGETIRVDGGTLA
jgi:meso-butanediol dehydrogenase/(S,S)-butanediol dehydrogenase/diacetyl reductase